MRASCFPGMCSSPGPFLAFRIPLATVLTLWEMSAWHYPGIFEFRQKDHGPIEAAISSGCPTSSESGSTPQKNKLCENSLHLTTGSLGTLSHREQELGCKFARPGATSEGGMLERIKVFFHPDSAVDVRPADSPTLPRASLPAEKSGCSCLSTWP